MIQLDKRICFIGAGNMAEAIINGLLKSKVSKPENLFASDVNAQRLGYIAKQYGINTDKNNIVTFQCSDIIFLAVKPQHINAALKEITNDLNPENTKRKIIVSIAAGIPIKQIEKYFYANKDMFPIIRVMPNTPALVLSGMAGMAGNRYAKKEDLKITRTVLEAIGKVIQFEETDLDAVTALSGSGPAYVFYFAESLITAGKSLGLSEADSLSLTIETIKGSVKLIEESTESVESLRKKVTSPGGTTEAAFKVLKDCSAKEIIVKAIHAAAKRSKELCA